MKKGAYDASLGPLFKPKMTRQGVRDLNYIRPAKRQPTAPQAESSLNVSIRHFAAGAIAAHEEAGDTSSAAIWRFIINGYNREIDRLTAELASARKGDRT